VLRQRLSGEPVDEDDRELLMLLGSVGIWVGEIVTGLFREHVEMDLAPTDPTGPQPRHGDPPDPGCLHRRHPSDGSPYPVPDRVLTSQTTKSSVLMVATVGLGILVGAKVPLLMTLLQSGHGGVDARSAGRRWPNLTAADYAGALAGGLA
jgi:hypothetical protein